MALFQKKPEVGSRISYTTYGMNKIMLVVGLGNPGKEYEKTRHNAGFIALDDFARRNDFDPWIHKKDLQCDYTSATIDGGRVILCKPTTFMNLSGEAVQAIANFYKVQPVSIVVVYDDLDVNFGQLRMRMGGSAAGHNGIKSISKMLGTEEYGRVRIGIGPKKPEQIDSADFVLQDFSKAEQGDLPLMTQEVSAILSEYAYGSPISAETRSFL